MIDVTDAFEVDVAAVVAAPVAGGRTEATMTVVVAAEAVALLLADAVGDALVDVAGVGAANRRMNMAKTTMSDDKSAAVLPVGSASVKLVVSSGRGLNWQLGVVSRLKGKLSLVTPSSTL